MTNERKLPYDVDMEQALLGCLLVDERNFWPISDSLAASDFYDPVHSRIFSAVAKIASSGGAATPLTVTSILGDLDAGFNEVGGRKYLMSLARAAPAMGDVKGYAKILRSLARRRSVIQIATEMADAAYDEGDADVVQLADDAAQALYDATHGDDPGEGPISLFELSHRALKDAERAYTNPKDVCLTSGLHSVDEALGMLFRGDLLVIGAATSMGKTAFIQKMLRANVDVGHAALMYSLEMAGTQLATRYMAEDSQIPSNRIRQGNITPGEFNRLSQSPNAFHGIGDRFKIDSTQGLSVAQMRARALAFRRKQPRLALVVADHLQYIRPADPRATMDEQARQITRDLCSLAKELDVALVLISHLTKENERRTSKKPIMSDLYGSGGIAQNADSVWFLYRHHYYLKREEPDQSNTKEHDQWLRDCDKYQGKAELYSTKARMGAVGNVQVGFNEVFTRFYDLKPKDVSTVNEQESLELAARWQ